MSFFGLKALPLATDRNAEPVLVLVVVVAVAVAVVARGVDWALTLRALEDGPAGRVGVGDGDREREGEGEEERDREGEEGECRRLREPLAGADFKGDEGSEVELEAESGEEGGLRAAAPPPPRPDRALLPPLPLPLPPLVDPRPAPATGPSFSLELSVSSEEEEELRLTVFFVGPPRGRRAGAGELEPESD